MQSQIGVIPYDSEADPILVSEFPPSLSRRPLLTSNMAVWRFHAGFAKRISAPFQQGLLAWKGQLVIPISFSNRWNFLLEAF